MEQHPASTASLANKSQSSNLIKRGMLYFSREGVHVYHRNQVFTSALIALGTEAVKKLLSEVVQQKGISALNKLDREVTLPQFLKNWRREAKYYVGKYVKRHGCVKVLSMREGLSIDQIYAEVDLLRGSHDSYVSDLSLQELKEEYQKVRDLLSIQQGKYKRVRGLDLARADENKRLVILGGPGMGKTTFLKKLSIEAWKDTYADKNRKVLFPVFLELKKLANKDINLRQEIIDEMRICGIRSNTDKFLDILLHEGRVLLLLDGLDELPQQNRVATVDKIQDFADEYSENSFVVSCRLAAYRSKRLSNFLDVEIAAFQSQQVHQAINKLFSPEELTLSHDFLEKLDLPKNSSVKKLTNTPLLLVLVFLYYKTTMRFPVNRWMLYDKAVHVLLEKWNADKGLAKRYEDNLDTQQKAIILETLAYESFDRGRLFMDKQWMSNIIDSVLENFDTDSTIKSNKIIDSIELDNGLLIKHSDQRYSFSHESIQEFFCAQYISKRFSRIEKAIQDDRLILDDRWQDIFVFLAGSNQAEDIIEKLHLKAESFLDNSSAPGILAWASKQANRSKSQLPPAIKRSFLVYMALCFCYYYAKGEKLRNSVVECIKMCRALIDELWEEVPREVRKSNNLRKDVREFEKLMATLIVLRRNNSRSSRSHNSNHKNDEAIIKSVDNQIDVVLRQSKRACYVTDAHNIFKTSRLQNLTKTIKLIAMETKKESAVSTTHGEFCNAVANSWLESIELDYDLVKSLYSQDIGKLSDYIYTLTLIGKCGDSVKHATLKKWSEIQSKVLFHRWIGDQIGSIPIR